jgi:hypothetical protein
MKPVCFPANGSCWLAMKQLQEREISVAIIALPTELARHAVMLVESSTTVLL